MVKMSWRCEVVSVVLFVISLNTKISGLRSCQFDKNAMWGKKGNVLPIVCVYFVCSKENKRSKAARGNVLCYSTL